MNGDSAREEKRISLSRRMSIKIVAEHVVGLYARINIIIALCILTVHSLFLVWGSVLLWQINLMWLLLAPVGLMDIMLIAQICRPAKAKDCW
jgi:hypothetical protein